MAQSQERREFLHFQDIVDQARKSIQLYCPEWTDYNLSDPGITLIELFAYMTSQLNYRLNRVPERNYLKFLEMVGVKPAPPEPASTSLTFKLVSPLPLLRADGTPDETLEPIRIPAHTTQVATRRSTTEDEEIVFITTQERLVRPPVFSDLRRDFGGIDKDQQFETNYLVPPPTERDPRPVVKAAGFQPFQQTPSEGDTFYLGFAPQVSIEGYLLQLRIECAAGEGQRVTVYDPPLIWEAGTEQDKWQRVDIVADTTGGFNRTGELILRLPVTMNPIRVRSEDQRLYWLRCRLKIERVGQVMYDRSPRIIGLQAFVIGVATWALHSLPITQPEELGRSNGEPGQMFNLKRAPVLRLDPKRGKGEFVQVEENPVDGGEPQLVNWELRDDFSLSTQFDRHVTLDAENGRIQFGPAVRQPNGRVRQYGMIPTLGSRVWVSQYRVGGGAQGNVPKDSLVVLKQPISYVAEVTNHQAASGGQDAEPIEATILRAQGELKGRTRAVTATDYESLCYRSGLVTRVKCLEPGPPPNPVAPGWVELLVVPYDEDLVTQTQTRAELEGEVGSPTEIEAARRLSRLHLTKEHQDKLQKYLEPYRLLGIKLQISEPTYIGLKIGAIVRAYPGTNTRRLRQTVIKQLEDYLTPLGRLAHRSEMAVHPAEAPPEAWPFGRCLYVSDIYAKIQAVDGVEALSEVQIKRCKVEPAQLFADLAAKRALNFAWKSVDKGKVPVPVNGLIHLLNVDDIEVELPSDSN